MAADEMRDITIDKWSDDIWGSTAPRAIDPSSKTTRGPTPSPNLIFYFGRGDHWVAEQTREDLIKARGSLSDQNGKRNGPKMLVCEDGVAHGFCIREFLVFFIKSVTLWLTFVLVGHNDIMARKVAGFVQEIMDGIKED
jgi:hypothetical protein